MMHGKDITGKGALEGLHFLISILARFSGKGLGFFFHLYCTRNAHIRFFSLARRHRLRWSDGEPSRHSR